MDIRPSVLLLCQATQKNCLDWSIAKQTFNISTCIHKIVLLGAGFCPVMYCRVSVINCTLSVWFRDGFCLKD
jgi:hypothetical protein